MLYLQPPVGNMLRLAPASDDGPSLARMEGRGFAGFASGTAALAAAVRAACVVRPAVRPMVVIGAYGCPDLVAAVRAAGAEPRLVDLEAGSLCMDRAELERVLGGNDAVVAVIGTDLFGGAENWPDLHRLCAVAGVIAIRDCAQSLQSAGEIAADRASDFTVFSFGRGKPVYLQGGGALLYREDGAASASFEHLLAASFPRTTHRYAPWKAALYNALLQPRAYALAARLLRGRIGITRYEPLAAIERVDDRFVQLVQRAVTDHWANEDERTSDVLAALQVDGEPAATVPIETNGRRLLRLPVLAPTPAARDSAIARLVANGIGATAMYERVLPDIVPGLQPRDESAFPAARDVAGRLLTLPVHARLRTRDLDVIEDVFQELAGARGAGDHE